MLAKIIISIFYLAGENGEGDREQIEKRVKLTASRKRRGYSMAVYFSILSDIPRNELPIQYSVS